MRRMHPALGSLGLIAIVLAGCRSNAQQDLIARELRMQEDQLYAMEDYISQYQQLVCKYRMENSALRRQLAGDYNAEGGDELPPLGDRVGPLDERRTPSRGPTFREPETPGRNETAPSDTPIDVPDVPPLEGSTAIRRDTNLSTASFTGSNDSAGAAITTESHGEATLVAVNERTDDQTQRAATLAAAQPTAVQDSSDQVLLRGEVLANDDGGPRLVVDVQRLDRAGGATEFDGPLSLMLLARHENDQPQNLARWDFDADDVRQAAEPLAGEGAMRFYLELPVDTPSSNATEIWVRLLPRDGVKLLAHADADLQQPGEFSSDIYETLGTPASASASNSNPTFHVESVANPILGKGEWTTARPGQVANLPSEGDSGQWRASSEPMPVVQSAFATSALPKPIQRVAYLESARAAKTVRTFARPTWSPERNSAAARLSEASISERDVSSRRPVWSAER